MSYNRELSLDILLQINNAILTIQQRTGMIRSADDFLESPYGMEKLDATCMQFIAIGESLKELDKITNKELLVSHPEIPWKRIKGLRDIIAHHYFDIDAEEIWWILQHELCPLQDAISSMIADLS